MKKRELWRWGPAGVVVFECVVEGVDQYLWVNLLLPPPHEQGKYGLRVEVLCWFESLHSMNAGLAVMYDHFHEDSVLVAMRRRDDATRIVLYTAARESVVHERYLGVRAVLRPTAIGLRMAHESAWESFGAVLDAAGRGEHRPSLRTNVNGRMTWNKTTS